MFGASILIKFWLLKLYKAAFIFIIVVITIIPSMNYGWVVVLLWRVNSWFSLACCLGVRVPASVPLLALPAAVIASAGCSALAFRHCTVHFPSPFKKPPITNRWNAHHHHHRVSTISSFVGFLKSLSVQSTRSTLVWFLLAGTKFALFPSKSLSPGIFLQLLLFAFFGWSPTRLCARSGSDVMPWRRGGGGFFCTAVLAQLAFSKQTNALT